MTALVPESQQQYGSILTIAGENAEANSKVLKLPVEITHIAFGDANDEYVQPNRNATALVNEIDRIPVNAVDVLQATPESVPMVRVEALLPPELGNIVIREFAAVANFNGNQLFHAVGNCARIYVPEPINNGNMANPVILEMFYVNTSGEAIVEIDPRVVHASRDYVNTQVSKSDDRVAQTIIDQNGKDWFIEDGFLVTPQASAFNIKAGAGYVSGNRVTLEFDRSVSVPNKPSFIYVDAHREGTPTGEQVTLFDFVVTAEEKDDYTDANGVKHFVCKIAHVLADGSVSDLRPDADGVQYAVNGNYKRSSKNRFAGRIDVADYGAVGDEIADDTVALNAAADKARETGKQLWSESGKRYKTTAKVNFRYVALDFDAAVVGHHDDIIVELGGNASSRNNPRQYLFTGGRNGGATEIPSVRVMGMKGQEISVDYSDYLQVYADVNESRAVNYSCAYSRMFLKYIRKLELNTGARKENDFPWINENHFYMTSVMDIVIDGAYDHNNNKFYGGTLEGDSSSLEVIKGWQNYFYDLRFESSPTVHFHAGTWRNFVEYTWISSPAKLPSGTSANIIDEGEMNTISDVHERAMTRYPILSITPNNLLFDAESGLHNIAGVKGITIDKALQTLSASSWTQIFVSDYLPVSPSADSLISVTAAGVTDGGFRVTFEAYDENFVKIAPAEIQVVYPGIGNKPFAEDITKGTGETHWPEVNNYKNLTAYFSRNSNARYVRLSVIAAGSGITFKMLSVSIRNKTSAPDWNNVMPACNAPIFLPKVVE